MDPRYSNDHARAGVKASELIAAARAMLGCPFRHQGRSELTGMDCIGFFLIAAYRVGLLPREFERTDYGRAPSAELTERLAHHCDRLKHPEPGCVVAVRWPGDKRAGHLAICTGENLIHCYSDAGAVVEHGHRGAWLRWSQSYWWLRSLHRG